MGISYPAPEQACYGNIDQAKYDALLAKLKTDPGASALVASETTGSVTYQKISFEWTYDATKAELTMTIVHDGNWKAKIAGNEAIFGIIEDELISKV